ncbi:BCCT family transporter [Neisseria sp. Ec49-e6-T10]|uniref:BCCT family transporter n=1 Tax=Neisseria sp. Ec49-e6-T10 TaxID=3140744 RepID=UPI003EB84F5E
MPQSQQMSSKFLPFRNKINPTVFFISAIFIILLVVYTIIDAENANTQFKNIQDHLTQQAGWLYILAVAIILLSITFLACSRYGDIKLGPNHAQPDFSYVSWIAMLFCAGMGIGLMFFGVAEPVMHYLSPPVGEPGTQKAATEAMKLTFFHWGLHAWAIYAIVGLILAFFSFRHNLPLTLRSALYPIIGDKIYGPIGHAVDIFAILGTVFGVATTMGYGVLQINSGFNYLFNLPINTTVQVVLIIIVTCCATLSVVSGLNAGLRRLSELNMALAIILLLLIGILGPSVLLIKLLVQNTGAYLSEIVGKTFNMYAYGSESTTQWLGGWTLLYWGWWLSWSPFVGMFIARISRGRTIRQFVVGAMIIPTGFTLLWMTFFGGEAIHLIANEGATDLATAVQADVSVALFKFFEYFPFSRVLSIFGVLMVIIFFVTSADSAAMVVDMLASGGQENTPLWQRIFWSSTMGIVAIALLFSGGLSALQTMTIVTALPYAMVLLIAIYGLFKALQIDTIKLNTQQITNLAPIASHNPISWQRRIKNMTFFPKRSHVKRFVDEVVNPAIQMVADELQKQNIASTITMEDDFICIEVNLGNDLNFSYQVRLRAYNQPAFSLMDVEEDYKNEDYKYYRADVHLHEGGQDYDVMGWTKEQIINDILDQYEKHLHFLHLVR